MHGGYAWRLCREGYAGRGMHGGVCMPLPAYPSLHNLHAYPPCIPLHAYPPCTPLHAYRSMHRTSSELPANLLCMHVGKATASSVDTTTHPLAVSTCMTLSRPTASLPCKQVQACTKGQQTWRWLMLRHGRPCIRTRTYLWSSVTGRTVGGKVVVGKAIPQCAAACAAWHWCSCEGGPGR